MTDAPYLVADFGGTNARLAIDTPGGLERVETYKCADFSSLADVIRRYQADVNMPDLPAQSVIGVAGPVDTPENFRFFQLREWGAVNFSETGAALGTDIHLVNDFTLQAYALLLTNPDGFAMFEPGRNLLFHPSTLMAAEDMPHNPQPDQHKTITVMGPGTGLGTATATVLHSKFTVLPNEAGHMLFAVKSAPVASEREMGIFRELEREHGVVTAQTLCSGPGLVNIYNAINRFEKRAGRLLTPEQVSEAGIHGIPPAREALEMFTKAFARCAQSIALTNKAFGGLVVTGGIIHKLGEHFDYALFKREFTDHVIYPEFLESIPVVKMKDAKAGLLGAAAYARYELSGD